MSKFLVSLPFPLRNATAGQSVKGTAYAKLRRSKTADENAKFFILDPPRRTIPLLFTIYLQSLHFYLQSKPLNQKNIKVDSLNQF